MRVQAHLGGTLSSDEEPAARREIGGMKRVRFRAEDGSIGKKKCARYNEGMWVSLPACGEILGDNVPSKRRVAKQSPSW
jgi:hypothetical protein